MSTNISFSNERLKRAIYNAVRKSQDTVRKPPESPLIERGIITKWFEGTGMVEAILESSNSLVKAKVCMPVVGRSISFQYTPSGSSVLDGKTNLYYINPENTIKGYFIQNKKQNRKPEYILVGYSLDNDVLAYMANPGEMILQAGPNKICINEVGINIISGNILINGTSFDIEEYYTKKETYNKEEIYSKEETYSKEEVDELLENLKTK